MASVPSSGVRATQWGDTTKPYREIAALSPLQVICFLLLSHLERDSFLLHFYQTFVYLAI